MTTEICLRMSGHTTNCLVLVTQPNASGTRRCTRLVQSTHPGKIVNLADISNPLVPCDQEQSSIHDKASVDSLLNCPTPINIESAPLAPQSSGSIAMM